MENKDIVRHFIEDVFNKHDLSLVPQYLAEDYHQHNPHVQQGAEGFVAFFTGMFERAPGFRQEIVHLIAEGDTVEIGRASCSETCSSRWSPYH